MPQLRGVARTAPYFHDNSHETLRDVIDGYSRFLLPVLTPLGLPAVHPPERAGGRPEALSPGETDAFYLQLDREAAARFRRRGAADHVIALHSSAMRLLLAASVACLCACVTERAVPRSGAAVQRRSGQAVEPCVISGCSGQVCATEAFFSTCEWRPEYACFANATCAPQAGGACGWVMTEALRACLQAAAEATH